MDFTELEKLNEREKELYLVASKRGKHFLILTLLADRSIHHVYDFR